MLTNFAQDWFYCRNHPLYGTPLQKHVLRYQGCYSRFDSCYLAPVLGLLLLRWWHAGGRTGFQ